ncbi:MAG: hypothetical protein NVSMB6_14160 [Burkholderiaceae bacterium]
MQLVGGPNGTLIPYFNDYAYAFIGKVVGYGENEWKDPALDIQVLDAWTSRQKNGDILKISVQPWSGCNDLPRARGNFDPTKYPAGTRLRVITFSPVIASWDSEVALLVLGLPP